MEEEEGPQWKEYEFKEVPFFSTPEDLEARKGPLKKQRFHFLQALVTEFQETINERAKEEVLANLANFAYDPVNYAWLRQLHVIDLFLDMLVGESDKLKEFGIGGICNLCIGISAEIAYTDPINAQIIRDADGIPLIIQCLSSSHEETVLSTITTLYYLLFTHKSEVATPPVMECIKKYATSANPRLKNLATVFVQEVEIYLQQPSPI